MAEVPVADVEVVSEEVVVVSMEVVVASMEVVLASMEVVVASVEVAEEGETDIEWTLSHPCLAETFHLPVLAYRDLHLIKQADLTHYSY